MKAHDLDDLNPKPAIDCTVFLFLFIYLFLFIFFIFFIFLFFYFYLFIFFISRLYSLKWIW